LIESGRGQPHSKTLPRCKGVSRFVADFGGSFYLINTQL